MQAVKGRPGMFKTYVAPVGVLTIGWGHTNGHLPKFTRETVWTQGQCDQVLADDMSTFEANVTVVIQLPRSSENTGGSSSAYP